MTGILDRFGLTGSMKPKLIALFLLVSIIPIITVSYLAFEYGSASTEEQVIAHLTSIVDMKKNKIEHWLEQQINDAEVLSSYARFVNFLEGHKENAANLPKLEYDAINLLKTIDDKHQYKRLSLIDNSGEVLVSTHPEDVGSMMNAKYAITPLITGEIYVQDIFKTAEDNFSMIFAAPIFPIDAETYEKKMDAIGVLIIEIDMAESLYPIVGNLHGMGETSEMILVRREGNEVVYMSELRKTNESALHLRFPINSTIALPAIGSSGEEEGIMITEDYRGEEVLSAYRHIDYPKWEFIAKIDKDEAFAGIDDLRNKIMSFSVFLIFIAFGMAIWISNGITRPIKNLEKVTKKVAQGDFSEHPKVTSNDEIGSLTNSFLKMETNLAKSRKELEDYSENLQHEVKKRTSELVESEERFKTMFGEAPLGIALIDSLTGHIYEVNSMFAKITGRSQEQMATIDWMSITHSDDVQENLDNMALLNAGKIDGFQMEIRYIHPDGTVVWINMTIAPMKVKDKSHPRHLCMIEDVTERKKAEKALQESERSLLRAQEIAHVGDWELDIETGVSIWSDELYRIYGFEPADEIEVETMIAGVHPDDRDYVNETLAGWIKNGGGEPFEYRVERPDGSIRHVYSPSETVFDSDGNVVKLYGTVLDITELKKMADKIKQMNLDLEQKVEERTSELTAVNKELEAFSYSVSHDLRAPLRSVDGFSQALMEDYGDKFDETGTDYLNRVRNATLDMEQLIDDLLNLSRITRGKVVYKKVYLSDLASEIAERYKIEQPDRRVELNITEGLKVNGDKRLFKAMLENLISNAYKFSSHEPITKIEFGMTKINDKNIYYIRDNGVGFDMKYADKLFNAFQRLHSKAEFPGTGIGLATVQRIIHKHGGHIWAESEPGNGVTFYFTL